MSPVRSGAVPSLADGFAVRVEAAAGLAEAFVPGAVVVLVPERTAEPGSLGWVEASGKTQLAVCVAESLWRSGTVELLVWITATSRAAVLAALAEAAEDVLGADLGGSGELLARRFLGWLAETRHPWLVVFDDLSDIAAADGLWPRGPAGRVLVTATGHQVMQGQDQALVHPVGAFSSREALSYLMGRLTADPDQRLGAIDLVADLGGEPLALAQASAVIAGSALSCRDYRDYFVRRQEDLAKAGGSGDPPAAAVTWAISVEQARRLDPGGATQAVLALAAVLDGHAIPAALFTTAAACDYIGGGGRRDPGAAERAGGALAVAEQVGLLSGDAVGDVPVVRVNQVVQAAVRSALTADALGQAAVAAAAALAQAWPDDEQPSWVAASLRAGTASVQRVAGDLLWANGCHPVLARAGRSLDTARLTSPAVMYWRDLAAACDRALGRGHPDTLAAGERLAAAYLAAGRAAEAVSWFRWVLAERVRVLGPDHPSAITARGDLGRALVAAGQYGDAVSALDRVAGDYQRTRGADQPETLGAWEELAAAHHAAGQYGDAIRLYRRVLADRERVQGPQHPLAMTTRHRLADAYRADGKLKPALAQYKRVLSDRERVLGPDHLDTIAVRGTLGSAYHEAGRMASAIHFQEQTRDSYQRALGPDHPDTLASSAGLAHTYYTVGRVTDALTLLRDTAERAERVLPPGDPLTEAVRQSLANIAG